MTTAETTTTATDADLGLDDPTVASVLAELHRAADANDPAVMDRVKAAALERGATTDAELADVLADAYMCIDDANGRFLHLLARRRPAGTIVEFGCSMGLSTIYLATALGAGDGAMTSTELEASKIDAAMRNVAAAGLARRVSFRHGDALETLQSFDEPIGLLFLDGWKGLYLPVLQLLEPLLVDGAIVVADDTLHPLLHALTEGYREYVRRPANGYFSIELPIDDGLEISLRTVSQLVA
jgi:predicted O-methyltransferase YrrM